LHLKNILSKENLEAEEQALALIAKMSEGSVRDSLSLLDQALATNNHQKILPTDLVEKMLGLSNRAQVVELFEKLLSGDFSASLKVFAEFYSLSSDVLQLIYDLLEITHKTTSVKLVSDYKLEGYSQSQQEKIAEIAQKISLNSLTRIWQMLSKGVSEINFSASPKMAFEMLMARICHIVALPNLQQVLLGLNENKNPVAKEGESKDTKEENLLNEILRNFEGAKVI
jgi:DNA polymerase-3 subunit gamma/tau